MPENGRQRVTNTNIDKFAVWGERWPAFPAGLFAVVGLMLGTLTFNWTLANARRVPEGNRVGTDFDHAPVPIRVAAPTVIEPEPKPVIVPEVAEQPALSPDRDCPPFFAIRFARGSAAPQFEQDALVELVSWMNVHPESNLVVDGHSDSLGSPAVNLGLSRQRADRVVKRFLVAGFPRDRMTRRAFGDYIPIVGAMETSAENRRVVLSITGLKGCSQLESQ